MASVPSVTLDKIDLVVVAVADRIISAANKESLESLTASFRQFAEGVVMLIGTVPESAEPHGAS